MLLGFDKDCKFWVAAEIKFCAAELTFGLAETWLEISARAQEEIGFPVCLKVLEKCVWVVEKGLKKDCNGIRKSKRMKT